MTAPSAPQALARPQPAAPSAALPRKDAPRLAALACPGGAMAGAATGHWPVAAASALGLAAIGALAAVSWRRLGRRVAGLSNQAAHASRIQAALDATAMPVQRAGAAAIAVGR
jgi:hypothetical protein